MAATMKVHGKDVRTFVGGIELTGGLDDVGITRTVATASRPRMGQDRVGRLIGQRDATITLAGLLPRTATALDQQVRDQDGGYAGVVFGTSKRGVFGKIHQSGTEIGTAQGDRGTTGATLQVTGGLRAGDVLFDPASRTHTGSPHTFGAVDLGAALTARRPRLYIVVSDYTLAGAGHGILVVAQHSTAQAFTSPTTLVSGVKIVRTGAFVYEAASAGTVNRYVRATITVTGTGSFTAAAMLWTG